MTIKPVLCAALLAACSAVASTNLPPGAPLSFDVPCSGKPSRDPMGMTFTMVALHMGTCIAMYVYTHSTPDPYDSHVWVLQRRSPSYNGGQWENLSQKICPLTQPDRAYFMFSDRIDRDTGGGASFCQYRVVDMGSYTP